MTLTVEIPDNLALPLVPEGTSPARAAVEAMAIEAYQGQRLTSHQLGQLLGMTSRFAIEAFLASHDVCDYSAADFEQDLKTIRGHRA